MPSEIQIFTRESLSKGFSKSEINKQLKAAGWPSDEIQAVLELYVDADFPIPVPRRKPYLSAREAFLYLVMFFTLYLSSISFGTLLFQFINRALPDPLEFPYYLENIRHAIRWSTSSLVIAFPVFIYASWLLNKAMRKDPEKRGSKIRKWLTYVTLFIAAGVIIGDLISLVFNLLGGEFTLRFVLKVTVVGAIAGTIFGYYLWDLRLEEKDS